MACSSPPNRILIAMTTQPRPQGHSATRNVSSPPPPRPALQIWEEGTLTPHPQAWSLAPGSQAMSETTARAQREGPNGRMGKGGGASLEARPGARAVGGGASYSRPGHLGPVTS